MKLKDLEAARACNDALEWFTSTYGDKGASFERVLKDCPRADWMIWGLWNLEPRRANIEQIIYLGLTAGRRSLRFASSADIAVLTAAYDAAKAVVFNNCSETRSAAESAASAAWSAARSAAESAARSAAESTEHSAAADDCRALMRTKKYKSLSKKEDK